MVAKIKIGCAGFDYQDWTGSFYPKSLNSQNKLKYYAQYFDINEINSSFYNLPSSKESVKKWLSDTPPEFEFTIKVWKEITHKLTQNPDIDLNITQFFQAFSYLEKKISVYLMQFPPWLKYSKKHLNLLNNALSAIPTEKPIFLEFRDSSWFKSDIVSNFQDKVYIATSYLQDLPVFFPDNQNRFYIRLIGDRQLSEFNRVQRIQEKTLNELEQIVEKLKEDSNIYEIFIIVNNHFSGFAPTTVNELKRTFKIPTKLFSKQRDLFSFLN